MVSAKGAAIRGGRRQDLGTARQEARPRLGGPKRRSQKNGCGSMGRTSDGAGGGKSDEALLERLEQKLQGKEGATTASTLRFVSKSRVQSLWAGYGSISEAVVVAAGDEGQGSRKEVAVVMKQVDAPSGSGVGHERKLRSYQNEAFFYSQLAPGLLAAGIAVPEPLLVESSGAGQLTLVMRDQREQFPRYSGSLSFEEAAAALSWLAGFHAFFWGEAPEGLWWQGTFWHLDTRREEFEGIAWRELKDVAFGVDAYLKGEGVGAADTRHMTVVHGDFKQENLLFAADGKRCAAHDFQYCGRGLGAKDIAYLFCSGLSSRLLPAREEELLQHYHNELMARLQLGGKGEGYTLDVLKEHFGLALVDFVRFMDGWGYWGNNRWATRKVEETLERHRDRLNGLQRPP